MKVYRTSQFVFLLFCLICSSCSIITKTRYGNGFKLNIGENWGRDKTEQESHKNERKQVKLSSIQKTEPPLLSIEDQTLNTITLPSNRVTQKSIPLESMAKPSLKNEDIGQVKLFLQNGIVETKPPYEPNAKWSGILFYGGVLILYLVIRIAAPLFLTWIPIILMIVSLFLALRSLENMKESGNMYRGRALAYSVVIFWILMFICLFLLLFLARSIVY